MKKLKNKLIFLDVFVHPDEFMSNRIASLIKLKHNIYSYLDQARKQIPMEKVRICHALFKLRTKTTETDVSDRKRFRIF